VKDAISLSDNKVLIVYKNENGTITPRSIFGPAMFFPEPDEKFNQPLEMFAADQRQYLQVMFVDGKREHIKGPTKCFLNPAEHSKIVVKDAILVQGSEVMVVFREQIDGDVKREILHGPTLFFPEANERNGDFLQRYTADQHQYLVIRFKDGHKEHHKGPTHCFLDTVIHTTIEVLNAVSIDASEVMVVYRENEGTISRTVIRGPTLHVPAADEWIHEFTWHGKDHKEPNNKARKVPGGLKFTKLRIIPDQFYYNVSDVRTSDDTLLMAKLMIFFELVDLERMLDQTHDPIADFINAVCADVIAFTASLPYEMFLEKTALLSSLETYPQLVNRAKKIGYDISKVVFRGYHATDKLQSMHDEAIQTRTSLRLQNETEEQAQSLADLKLLKEVQRASKRHEMEQQDQSHKNTLSRKEFEEKLSQKVKDHDEELRYLEKIKAMGVDLTKYMTSQFQTPERVIQIRTDSEQNKPKIVFHNN